MHGGWSWDILSVRLRLKRELYGNQSWYPIYAQPMLCFPMTTWINYSKCFGAKCTGLLAKFQNVACTAVSQVCHGQIIFSLKLYVFYIVQYSLQKKTTYSYIYIYIYIQREKVVPITHLLCSWQNEKKVHPHEQPGFQQNAGPQTL